jgi:ABC-type Fe3+-hydroxamate transport system substrate-binding protein
MAEARRIVSLCPSISETLAEIGAGRRLVGVTRYCIRPPSLKELPKVGGTKALDFSAIEALAPDIIFANAEENRRQDIEALDRKFRLHVSLPNTVAAVPPLVRELGREAGEPERASELAEEIGELCAGLEGKPAPTPFRYAYFIWRNPWMTISGDTYVSDLLRFAGGVNVFCAAKDRYPKVTPEAVLAAQPDVLLFSSEPYPFSDRHRSDLEAAFPGCAIAFVDGDDCCWHGARTRQGLKLMSELRGRFAR